MQIILMIVMMRNLAITKFLGKKEKFTAGKNPVPKLVDNKSLNMERQLSASQRDNQKTMRNIRKI